VIDAAMITIYAYECRIDHEKNPGPRGWSPLAAVDVSRS